MRKEEARADGQQDEHGDGAGAAPKLGQRHRQLEAGDDQHAALVEPQAGGQVGIDSSCGGSGVDSGGSGGANGGGSGSSGTAWGSLLGLRGR